MISFQRLSKVGVIAFCMCSAAMQVQAKKQDWISDHEGASKVGVQVKIERFTPTTAKQIKATGFSFVRFGVWTNSMQTAEYQKKVTDAFNAAQAADLPVLLTVRSTIPLARSSNDEAARNAQLRDSAKQLINVVGSLAGANGSDLLAVELWNEPELPTFWPTGDVDSTFPVYMQAVCSGLRAVLGTTPVIGFGFATVPASGSHSDKLLQSIQSPSSHCIDAVSYHAYGMSESQIREASVYVRSRYGLPAVITEWGVSSGRNGGIAGQAADIKLFLLKRNSMRTPLISIYEWQDTAHGKNARERNFGLVDASDTQKPALRAALTVFGKQWRRLNAAAAIF